jgi:hypothetical protein
LWCGIIIKANNTSASVCGPVAGVGEAAFDALLDGVLDEGVDGIEPMSWLFIDDPQPATAKLAPRAMAGAMS